MEAWLIPVVSIIATFGTVFGIFYLYITTRNRERMALIEKIEEGADPGIFSSPKKGTVYYLKWALLLIGMGIGLFMGYILDEYTRMDDDPAYFSMVFLFGGIALLTAFLIERKFKQSDQEKENKNGNDGKNYITEIE